MQCQQCVAVLLGVLNFRHKATYDWPIPTFSLRVAPTFGLEIMLINHPSLHHLKDFTGETAHIMRSDHDEGWYTGTLCF